MTTETMLQKASRERDEWKVKCQDQAAELERLRAELDRRGRNEVRNCVNWGPCSRHDGHMESAD